MADEIKPALAPNDWRRLLLRDSRVISLKDGDVIDLGPMPGDSRHALAALALYQQPFGFRREDVRLLEHAAERTYSEDFGGSDSLSDLARRVAALLPPEHANV